MKQRKEADAAAKESLGHVREKGTCRRRKRFDMEALQKHELSFITVDPGGTSGSGP